MSNLGDFFLWSPSKVGATEFNGNGNLFVYIMPTHKNFMFTLYIFFL